MTDNKLIQIRTLTIENRRLTRTLFRQVLEEPVIDMATGDFHGTLFGSVNYHVHACDRPDTAPHVHVLWLKQGELRQATVWRNDVLRLFAGVRGDLRFTVDQQAQALARVAYAFAGEDGLDVYFDRPWDDATQEVDPSVLFARLPCRIMARTGHPAMARRGDAPDDAERANEIPGLLAEMTEKARELQAWEDKAHGIWTTLVDLPQLFLVG